MVKATDKEFSCLYLFGLCIFSLLDVYRLNIEAAREFCEKWLAAWTGNQPLSLIEFYTEDCLYLDPAYPTGLKGHSEVLPYFKKLLGRNPNWEWKLVELFLIPDGFIVKWNASIPVGTKLIQESGVDIVELDGTKIKRNEVYFDRTKWLKALQKT
jgi:hypothetical protein